MTRRVDDPARRWALRRTTAVAAIVAFASAPIWYLVRGSFASFWASWWTYASYQYRGIGLSVSQELSRGGHNFYAYYRHRLVLLVMIAAFLCITITEWLRFDRKTRIVHLSLIGWFAGGWFQLISGERYSTHYFSVIAAPTSMIGAALAGHAFGALSTRWRFAQTAIAWPLLAVVLSFALSSSSTDRLIAAASITSGFTTVHHQVALDRANQPGADQSVQAVLDLVSRDRDPLLAFSDDQYLYPTYRRIPATRFQQRYFLIGSIYLGQTGPQYILHNTWKWFQHDLRQANPAAFLKTVPVDSKPFARYVSTRFQPVFSGSAGTVELRDDLARAVLTGDAAAIWTAPAPPSPGSGWSFEGNSAFYARSATPMSRDRLTLATHACERIDGALDSGPSSTPQVVFHVEDPTGHAPELRILYDGSYVSVEDTDGTLLDTVPVGTGSPGALHNGPAPFALVMGRRAAALVIGGTIVAAVAMPHHVEVTLESQQSQLAVQDLRVGAPPPDSGC